MTGGGVTDRLPRLLSLVPYLRAHPGVRISEAAADFGVDERQLRRDLELLWMCGLPGYGPGDLVDLAFSGDTVSVVEDAGMQRPLRLTTAEATALLVALRTLHETPGLADTDAVARATGKIEAAVGAGVVAGTASPTAPVPPGERVGGADESARESAGESARTTATVRDALERGRSLRIVYFTAGRDAVSRRVVDPMRLLLVDGRGYLEAWCRRAEGVRLFRLDRVEAAEVLDEPAQPPPDAEPTDVSVGLYRPAAGQRTAQLELAPDAHWVAEYYPVDDAVEDRSTGSVRVTMRYSDPAWMVRLVLGLGGGARVLAPPELDASVRARARAALESTGSTGTTGPAGTPDEPQASGERTNPTTAG